MAPKLKHGLDLSVNQLVHVDEVARRGKDCLLVCPKCSKSLIAKQGDIRTWHFAHSYESDCKGAVETALHRRAKEIIANSSWIVLPGITAFDLAGLCRRAGRQLDTSTSVVSRFWNSGTDILPGRRVEYSQASIEHRFDDDEVGRFVADAVLRSDVDYIVEIKVSHAVDEVKASSVQASGVTAMEIEIDPIDTEEMKDTEFVEYVLEKAPRKFVALAVNEIDMALSLARPLLDEAVAAAEEKTRREIEDQKSALMSRSRFKARQPSHHAQNSANPDKHHLTHWRKNRLSELAADPNWTMPRDWKIHILRDSIERWRRTIKDLENQSDGTGDFVEMARRQLARAEAELAEIEFL